MEEKARQHIEEIRKHKFLIGQKISNPLTQDLHNAVINLSAELYTKDVHFLMELIQILSNKAESLEVTKKLHSSSLSGEEIQENASFMLINQIYPSKKPKRPSLKNITKQGLNKIS